MESFSGVARGAAKAAVKPPVRMCCWYVPNGVHLPTWFPQNEGTLVDLPNTLKPLSFAREYLNCFHGLTHNSAMTNGDTVTYLGPDAEPAVPALVQTLRSDYGGLGKEELHQDSRSALALAAVGKQIAKALGQIGRPAVGLLVKSLQDPDPRVRRGAALALGQVRPLVVRRGGI